MNIYAHKEVCKWDLAPKWCTWYRW